MDIFTEHKWWWTGLLLATVVTVVHKFGEVHPVVVGIPVVGHFLISFIIAGIPWLIYRLMKRPLSSDQFMWTFTVAWLLLAIPQWIPNP